ncbi:MAG: hypothetical protein D6767_06385 [Candidatus Hydrogenedentota bacterium]|nr:MAG: hypothetical protein D6767_06385 [Candidatus Hydrogenedentota bacterium]
MKKIIWVLLITCNSFLFSDYWKDSSGYQSSILTVPLWENKKVVTSPQTGLTYTVYFSVATTPTNQVYGGTARVFFHIRWQKKKYTKPLSITVIKDGKKVIYKTLKTVNYPVSIQKPSSYFVQFPFKRKTKYLFIVRSLKKDFPPVSFPFIYPPSRF